jgi:hypothetical protein
MHVATPPMVSCRRRSDVYLPSGPTVPSIVILGTADGIGQDLMGLIDVLKL